VYALEYRVVFAPFGSFDGGLYAEPYRGGVVEEVSEKGFDGVKAFFWF